MKLQNNQVKINKWIDEIERLLQEANIYGMTNTIELKNCWIGLYNAGYSPRQAFNFIVLDMRD